MPNSKTVATCGLCVEMRPIVARGLCNRCYTQARKRGTLDSFGLIRLPFAVSLKLARESATPEGCWPWATVNQFGYPSIASGGTGRGRAAHVISWESINGPVPDGLQLDHLCHTNSTGCAGGTSCEHRRCVNPEHLEPVTGQEQQRRKHGYRRPTCVNNHDRESNVMWVRDVTGLMYRKCRTCHNDRERVNRAKRAERR